ncbi:hypothetical protein TeGR_g3429 [Tetraparma gracilis]|uniref:Helicase ATP-binding domain-containing protein n=1 Tax=Tetraparma gracilis TaxID=2962635 RepID=A0ABQ6MJR0_9STRA|nr:hypothetical protein TeGR_g3429 [Tetraparma gracilis]
MEVDSGSESSDDGGLDEPLPTLPSAPPLSAPLLAAQARLAAADALALSRSKAAAAALLSAARASAPPPATTQDRLNYLMSQGEVFAHFLAGGAAPPSPKKKAGEKGKPGTPQRKGRKTEEAEDAELLAAAEASRPAVRITAQPANLSAGTEMHGYQVEGLSWLVRLHDSGINGVLADEMGLGKTLQTISLLAHLREARGIQGPHLVVVPKSVTGNWIREIAKWCPEIRALKLPGTREARRECVERMRGGGWDVVVTSYEGVLKEQAYLKKIDFEYLIIDEAHRIKNENSSLSQVVRLMSAKHRLLITGTPLQNNLHELWALLNFLLPDVFGDANVFDSWFSLEAGEEAKDNVIKKLHSLLRPFMLRRIKKDVAHALPPKKETKLFVGMTEMQKELYKKILQKESVELNALGGAAKGKLMNVLMQLRKVTNHPYLFQGIEPGPPYCDGPHLWENAGKMSLLHKLLVKLKAAGSRVLIFSQMTRVLDILEVDLQAMDRAHRIGQKKPVQVFRFLTEGSVEEKIAECADRKLFLDAAVIQQGRLADQHKGLQKDDLMKMVSFGADQILNKKGATYSDEDIDVLLARGEEKTAAQAALLQKDVQHNLANFSLMGDDENGESSLYAFGGEDYGAHHGKNVLMIDIGARERKISSYAPPKKEVNVDAMLKRKKKSSYYDHQFYNVPELEELQSRALALSMERETAMGEAAAIREKARTAPSIANARAAVATGDYREELLEVAAKMEAEATAKYAVPDSDLKERARLEAEGFDWSKEEFKYFVSTLEEFGRYEVDKLVSEMEEDWGKTADEVKRYYIEFMWRYREIEGWEKIISRWDKAEAKMRDAALRKDAVAWKLNGLPPLSDKNPAPWERFEIEGRGKSAQTYSPVEDQFLLWAVGEFGAEYERIRAELLNHYQFRFNFFLRAKTVADIKSRCEYVTKLVIEEWQAAKKAGEEAEAKRKKKEAKEARAKEGGGGDTPSKKQKTSAASSPAKPKAKDSPAKPKAKDSPAKAPKSPGKENGGAQAPKNSDAFKIPKKKSTPGFAAA